MSNNDEMTDFTNLDATILSILINNQKELRDFVSIGNEEVFEQGYRRFVRQLIHYYKTFTSCPSLNSLLEYCSSGYGNLENYLVEIWNEITAIDSDAREYSFLLSKINKRYNESLLEGYSQKIQDKLKTGDVEAANTLLVKAHNEVKSLGAKRVYTEGTLKEDVEEYAQNFKARQQDKTLSRGVMTGFSAIDYYTNGLRPSELGFIAADTGGGKSVFLIDLGVNMWMQDNILPLSISDMNKMVSSGVWNAGEDVLFISLEMPKTEIEDRILSNMCSVNSLDMMKGKISSEEGKRLGIGLKFWKNFPFDFYIVDMPRGCSMSQVQTIFEDCCLKLKRKPKITIIDYLGLMKASGTHVDQDADWLELKDVAEEMHEFSRVNEVATFSGLQVKTSKPGEGGIGLHRIGRSSMILHNANMAFQIENRENEEMRQDAVIHCIKFRRGPKFVMRNLRKEFMYSRFADEGFVVDGEPQKDTGKLGEDLTEQVVDGVFSQTDHEATEQFDASQLVEACGEENDTE